MKNANIKTILERTITAQPTDWSAIVGAFPKGAIKNWMTVRNVLQGLLNAGTVRRTDDTRREQYVKVQA